MGIHRLFQQLEQKCPQSFRKTPIDVFVGKTVVCDASNAMYQFLVSTASTNQNNFVMDLTDKDGNRTGHLVGLLMRTQAYHECGVKCIWVFDGKPPTMKGGELARRKKAKLEAKEAEAEAKETGDAAEQMKFHMRQVILILISFTKKQ